MPYIICKLRYRARISENTHFCQMVLFCWMIHTYLILKIKAFKKVTKKISTTVKKFLQQKKIKAKIEQVKLAFKNRLRIVWVCVTKKELVLWVEQLFLKIILWCLEYFFWKTFATSCKKNGFAKWKHFVGVVLHDPKYSWHFYFLRIYVTN